MVMNLLNITDYSEFQISDIFNLTDSLKVNKNLNILAGKTEEVEKLTRFFFGDELSDRVVKESLIQLPECAGIWWLTI